MGQREAQPARRLSGSVRTGTFQRQGVLLLAGPVRNTRGLTRSVIARMVPPLPAVSRPSNNTTTRRKLAKLGLQSAKLLFVSLALQTAVNFAVIYVAHRESLPLRKAINRDRGIPWPVPSPVRHRGRRDHGRNAPVPVHRRLPCRRG